MITRSLIWLVASFVAVAVTGCGTETYNAADQGSNHASTDTRTAPSTNRSPKRRAISPAASASRVVRRYYAGVQANQYAKAWSQLSPQAQAGQGSFAGWKQGYASTVDTSLTRLDPLAQTSSRVVVDVGLRSVDVDECGDTVRQRFEGTWTLERLDGTWKGTKLQLERVAGRAPITELSDCPDLAPPDDYGSQDPPPEPDYDYEDPAPEPDYYGDDSPDHGDGYSPPAESRDFCDTHDCIPNYPNGRGSITQCEDGSYSHSGGIQGACSHHGGVAGP